MSRETMNSRRGLQLVAAALPGCLAAVAALAVLVATPRVAWAGQKPACEISIVTEPPQATVVLDGKKEQSLTPVNTSVAPGTHFLVINKSGYEESRRRFTVGPEQTRLLLDTRLEPVLGLVLIHSQPTGAEITIDDALRGHTPLLLTDIRPGRYRVRANLQGSIPVEKMLDVADRSPQKLEIVMRSDSGEIKCSSEPAGAEIAVNGAARGQTPSTVQGVPPGKVVVTLSLEGYRQYEETVEVQAGDELKVNATLKPLPASLEVFSIPDGAVVYVDNERRGKAPLTIETLEAGEHRIRAEMPGFEPLARTVDLKQGKRTPEEFRLERIAGALEITTTPPGVKVLVDNIERGVTKGEPDKPDGASLPLLVENLDPGSHTALMIRKGYEKATATVEIVKSQKATLTQELKKLFIPDILLRTGDGPNDMYTGAVVERYANGDIKLELKPGIFRVFRKSEIQSEKSLFSDAPPRKE